MFSRTVLCGKRLNCWKTMPTRMTMGALRQERTLTHRLAADIHLQVGNCPVSTFCRP